MSGTARSEISAAREETSVRHGWRPVRTSGSASSRTWRSRRTPVTIAASDWPLTGPGCPIRWIAETAFGLA